MFFSQYVDGGDGRIVLQLFYNRECDLSHKIEGYELEVHQFMKNTNRMNVSSIALYPVNPLIPYLIINSIFYDFMDVTNVSYFNQEGHFYNPSKFNTVAYVLKYHGTVVDVLGEPHSQDQLFPQGGTFVRKQGITCGSPVFNQQNEWIAYPKGTYQYVDRHTL
ncbi:hypothetical protein [Paenibacillus polymyxa]|uniref:hypothetical protein n=1 Tax=Paenibacillus polymyxa TaxID=1406 RepID=UPI0007E94219|nr:hypothetical protein [Paenibacillus polymyxa]OAZ49489.1 RTX toxin [Paenibacillus polymyxa]